MKLFNFLSKHQTPKFTLLKAEDVPEKINDFSVHLIGSKGREWLLMMKCPCGCGDLIQLNMLPDCEPRWTLKSFRSKYPTIYPSIDRFVGCRSHFNMRKGKVLWFNASRTFDEE